MFFFSGFSCICGCLWCFIICIGVLWALLGGWIDVWTNPSGAYIFAFRFKVYSSNIYTAKNIKRNTAYFAIDDNTNALMV